MEARGDSFISNKANVSGGDSLSSQTLREGLAINNIQWSFYVFDIDIGSKVA